MWIWHPTNVSTFSSAEENLRERKLEVIWLDTAHVMRSGSIEGLHEQVEGVTELHRKGQKGTQRSHFKKRIKEHTREGETETMVNGCNWVRGTISNVLQHCRPTVDDKCCKVARKVSEAPSAAGAGRLLPWPRPATGGGCYRTGTGTQGSHTHCATCTHLLH